jgi:hypothetical protein
MEERPSPRETSRLTLLTLGTLGIVAVWLAAACYAITYLISH